MSQPRSRTFRPAIDYLDGRRLLSAGITASLSAGVLAVQGTSPAATIRVDVSAVGGRHGAPGSVTVEGVGTFPISRVRSIQIVAVAGEAVAVPALRRQRRISVHVSGIGGATDQGASPAPAPTAMNAPPSLPSPSPPTPGTMSALEQAVVDLTNQARVQNGLPPLQANAQLVAAAQTHSRDMARLNLMQHTLTGVAEPTPESRAAAVGYKYSWLGENIAYNFPDPPSLVMAWMNSPEHRANILNADFTEIGVGVAWNSAGEPYYTQEFGRPA